MMKQLELKLGNLSIEVVRKDIKNVHLRIHPPLGRVRISAPSRMSLDAIREFAVSKLDWIRRHQKRLQERPREISGEYSEGQSQYVWGRHYLLKVLEAVGEASVELNHSQIVLRVRPGTDMLVRQGIVDRWFRDQLTSAVPPLITKWELQLGVKVERYFVRPMKTRWGSCTPRTRRIRLNSALAKRLPECLEYVVVHEMVHLLEPSHNATFIGLMDRFMPHWRVYRTALSQPLVEHVQ